MKTLGAIAIGICLLSAGCGHRRHVHVDAYVDAYRERADIRRARDDFRRATLDARDELRRARRDLQYELRQAREQLRRDLRQAHRDFHREFDYGF